MGSIKRLITLNGDVSNKVMTVHFLQGSPAEVRLTVRNSVGDETLTVEPAVATAWSTMAMTARERATTPVAAAQPPPSSVLQHGRQEERLAVHHRYAGLVTRCVMLPALPKHARHRRYISATGTTVASCRHSQERPSSPSL